MLKFESLGRDVFRKIFLPALLLFLIFFFCVMDERIVKAPSESYVSPMSRLTECPYSPDVDSSTVFLVGFTEVGGVSGSVAGRRWDLSTLRSMIK